MAVDANSPARTAWETTYEHYLNLNQQLLHAPAADREHLENEAIAAENELLSLPSPSFMAVRTKLEMLWSAELMNPDQNGAEKRQVVDDLHRLIVDTGRLLHPAFNAVR